MKNTVNLLSTELAEIVVKVTIMLTREVLIFAAADEILIIIFCFRENKAWHFTWIVLLADDKHDVLSCIFSENL